MGRRFRRLMAVKKKVQGEFTDSVRAHLTADAVRTFDELDSGVLVPRVTTDRHPHLTVISDLTGRRRRSGFAAEVAEAITSVVVMASRWPR